uniref:CRAL/TRIO N-terminal domain-containing protein n=1 Tax=Lygus hesperus TaxID=30085 RepID=A0A146L3E2_LYGHE
MWRNDEKVLASSEEWEAGQEILCELQCSTDISVSTAIRFLRAKDHDVSTAKEYVHKHICWRNTMFPITPEEVREELSKEKINVVGRDRDGHIIVWIFSRNMGPNTYTSLHESIRSFVFGLERLETEVLGPYERFTVV